MVPMLGSMVQNGKFAAWALALLKQLNRVDFPTLGKPTIPHLRAIAAKIRFRDFIFFINEPYRPRSC